MAWKPRYHGPHARVVGTTWALRPVHLSVTRQNVGHRRGPSLRVGRDLGLDALVCERGAQDIIGRHQAMDLGRRRRFIGCHPASDRPHPAWVCVFQPLGGRKGRRPAIALCDRSCSGPRRWRGQSSTQIRGRLTPPRAGATAVPVPTASSAAPNHRRHKILVMIERLIATAHIGELRNALRGARVRLGAGPGGSAAIAAPGATMPSAGPASLGEQGSCHLKGHGRPGTACPVQDHARTKCLVFVA